MIHAENSCNVTNDLDGSPAQCQFPFIFDDIVFFGCTKHLHHRLWCSVKTNETHHHQTDNWAYCNDDCPKNDDFKADNTIAKEVTHWIDYISDIEAGKENCCCVSMENCTWSRTLRDMSDMFSHNISHPVKQKIVDYFNQRTCGPAHVYCCEHQCDSDDEVTNAANGCPPDWIRLQDTCYFFQEKDKKYSDAIDVCHDLGGKLFEPRDKDTNDMVFNIAKTKLFATRNNTRKRDWMYFWIGMDDIETEGVFKYNSDKTPVLLDAWANDEPNNGGGDGSNGEDCATFRGFGDHATWNDVKCTEPCEFICEKPIVEDATTVSHCKVYEHERIGLLNETIELKDCQFPFVYKNQTYTTCTTANANGTSDQPWCSTRTDSTTNEHINKQGHWGYCGSGCPQPKPPCTTDGGEAGPDQLCVFPYHFNGNTYNTCTWDYAEQTEHKAWCSTAVNDTGHHRGGQGKWGTCGPNCAIPDYVPDTSPSTTTTTTTTTPTTSTQKICTTNGGASPNKKCIFPFIHNNVTYNTCTWTQHHQTDFRAWCSTEIYGEDHERAGVHRGGEGLWGNCDPETCDIPANPHPNITTIAPPTNSTTSSPENSSSSPLSVKDHVEDNVEDRCVTVGGASGPGMFCVFPFIFRGKTYNSCSWDMHQLTDHKAWCSTAVHGEDHERAGHHRGGEGLWGTCDNATCVIPPKPRKITIPSSKTAPTTISKAPTNPHTAAIVICTFLAIIILLVSVLLLNYLQSNHKYLLPEKLQNWHFLPEPLRSLQPYKRFLRRFECCKMCLGDPEDEQLIYRRHEDLENNAEDVL